MPEGLEAEIWRRALSCLVGRTIDDVWIDERVAPPELPSMLGGCSIEGVRRRGKVVVVDTDGPSVGLHFGMTGRLVVDGHAPIERLEYASSADLAEWDRLRISTDPPGRNSTDAPAVRFNDPRRLGHVSIDPDLHRLGVDMFDLDTPTLRRIFADRMLPVKAALLDQHLVAGLGNLCADEVLWWAAVAPHRPAGSLTAGELRALARAIRTQLPVMLALGGSTTGTLSPDLRRSLAPCPRDGVGLQRSRIGGRTAVWCPAHQH